MNSALIAAGKIQGEMRMAIYSSLCAAHEIRKIKTFEPSSIWHQALAQIGVNEIRAQYLLNLIDEHDRRIRNGTSHWDVIEQFVAEGILEDLLGME